MAHCSMHGCQKAATQTIPDAHSTRISWPTCPEHFEVFMALSKPTLGAVVGR